MEIWSKTNFDEFKNYVIEFLNSEKNIKFFFKCFPYFWNGKINGLFKKEDFEYVTKVIKLDKELIYQKIKEIIPEIGNQNYVELKELSSSWNDKVNNTGIQNIQQFIFWYLSEENREKNLSAIFT